MRTINLYIHSEGADNERLAAQLERAVFECVEPGSSRHAMRQELVHDGQMFRVMSTQHVRLGVTVVVSVRKDGR